MRDSLRRQRPGLLSRQLAHESRISMEELWPGGSTTVSAVYLLGIKRTAIAVRIATLQ